MPWRPGSAVTILTQEPKVSVPLGRVSGPLTRTVVVSGQEQARLNSAGQYIAASGGVTAPNQEFVLQYSKGLWKISQLFSTTPGKITHELLLTSDLFHLEYAPRNLYYYGGRNRKLVPYPVFVPIQGTNPAVTLINDLISGPPSWLAGGAQSAFPPESHLVQPIQVFPGPSGGRTAVVNIAVPPQPPGFNVQAIAAQLVATLTSPVYSTPLFRAVKLKINGRPWSPRHTGDTLSLSTYQRDIPQWAAGEKAYYLSEGGDLRSLAGRSGGGSAVLRGTGAAPVTLSRIAVSPDGSHLAGLAGPANTVYTGHLPSGRQSLTQPHEQFTGISFTSLSWDNLGDLWVTGGIRHKQGVWVLPGGQAPAVPVQPRLRLRPGHRSAGSPGRQPGCDDRWHRDACPPGARCDHARPRWLLAEYPGSAPAEPAAAVGPHLVRRGSPPGGYRDRIEQPVVGGTGGRGQPQIADQAAGDPHGHRRRPGQPAVSGFRR